MLEKENFARNTRADQWRINYYRSKPTLRGIFSGREYRTLWEFLRPQWITLLLLIAISFVLAVAEGSKALFLIGMIKGLVGSAEEIQKMLTFSFMNRELSPVSFGLSPGRTGLLTLMFAGLLLFTGISAIGKFASTWYSKRIQLSLMRDVRSKTMSKIFSFDVGYFDQAKSGELIFLMNAETSRFSNLVTFANTFLTSLIQSAIFVGLLFYMSLDITLLVIGVAVVYFKLHLPLDLRSKQKSWESNLAQNTLSHIFHQIVYGIKMIKIGGCEERELEQFLNEHRKFESDELSLARLNGLSSMFREYAVIAILILVTAYISFFKNMNALILNPDKILAYLLLLSRALPAISSLQTARNAMIGAYGPLARVMELLHKDIKTEKPVSHDRNKLRTLDNIQSFHVENVHFSYGANGRILENINLNFEKDRIYALVGFSGSGKSTLLDIMSSVRQPSSGKLIVNGEPVENERFHSFKNYVGYMNQEPIIFHDTIRANVTYFKPEATDEEIWHALKLAAADEFIRDLPEGFHTGLGERGLTVSGGQRQRIGLARVLLQNAPVLLLDEATNALDYQTEELIYTNLKSLKDGRIIIVAAHRLSTLTDFNHIIVLNKGRIIEEGSHRELMANMSMYYNLFMIQEQGIDT